MPERGQRPTHEMEPAQVDHVEATGRGDRTRPGRRKEINEDHSLAMAHAASPTLVWQPTSERPGEERPFLDRCCDAVRSRA